MSVSVGQDDRLTLDQQVCFSLAVAAREVIALYRPVLQPLGLTHPQYLVLVTLWENAEPLCVKDLSHILRTEAPSLSLSPILKRLAAARFVQRQRDPTDERFVLIALTPEGRDLRRQAAHVPRPEASAGSVDRAMRALGLSGVRRDKGVRTTIPAKDGTRAADLLDRNFTAPAANRTWVTDFT